MALVGSSFTPRVSTAEPLDVPRWDSTGLGDIVAPPVSQDFDTAMPTPTLPDIDTFAQTLLAARQQTNQQAKGMSLADKIANQYTSGGGSFGTSSGGSYTGTHSGSFGPSAYGFRGRTGMAAQRGSAPYGFQPKMWTALGRANAAMKAAGYGTFGVTDGFRSYELQVVTKKKKGALAATPGRSVHGLGLAADLRLTAKQSAWLKANAGRFGLINLPSESWHYQLDPRMAGVSR